MPIQNQHVNHENVASVKGRNMNIHDQERILQILKRVQNISLEPGVGAIRADELEMLQGISERNGWFAKVIGQLLVASQYDVTEAKAVEALKDLSALVMKWALDLERQQQQSHMELLVNEKIYVLIPNNRVKFLGIVQESAEVYIPMLDQTFALTDVQILYRVPNSSKDIPISASFQNTLQMQLQRMTKMASKKHR